MKANELAQHEWQQAESLALNLSESGVPVNLVKQALAYLRAHSGQTEIPLSILLQDYLVRLRKIGPLFLSGNESEEQRRVFALAARQLISKDASNEKILQILGWAARLMTSSKPASQPVTRGRYQ